MKIDPSLQDLVVPIDSVTPKPGNARRHDLDDLKDSLKDLGQYRPIIVNRRTGHIVKGNGTHAAAKAIGATEIAVSFVDVDAADETRKTVVDNRTAELGWMNDAQLYDVLSNMEDLSGTGYVPDDVAWLRSSLEGPLELPPAPNDGGKAIQDARRSYEEGKMMQIVLVVRAAEHDVLLADLDALAEPGENIALVVKRLVLDAEAA